LDADSWLVDGVPHDRVEKILFDDQSLHVVEEHLTLTAYSQVVPEFIFDKS
jgi:hypothetical protein